METDVIAQLAPNYAANKEDALDQRSPVKWASRLNSRTPILIMHGTDDDKVSANEAIDMASKLLEAKRIFRLVLFENAGHRLHLDNSEEVYGLTRKWLATHLDFSRRHQH